MTYSKPKFSESLATEIADHIKPLAEQEILLPKTAEEIFQSSYQWFPEFDQDGNLIGFFEYREHEGTMLAEMGSMLVIKPNMGIGKCLLQKFDTQRAIWQATGGFAVTKDYPTAAGFFAAQTGGDVLEQTQFPDWFSRVKSDKYFVQWK